MPSSVILLQLEYFVAAVLAGMPLVLPEARWGEADPTRRQLSERARAAGVRLEPAIDVELPAAAVALAARGVADAVVSRSLLAATDVDRRLGWRRSCSGGPDALTPEKFLDPQDFLDRQGRALYGG